MTTCVCQLCTTSPIFTHFPTAFPPLTMRATTEVAVVLFLFLFLFYFLNTNFFSDTNQCNDNANDDDAGHAMMWPAGLFFFCVFFLNANFFWILANSTKMLATMTTPQAIHASHASHTCQQCQWCQQCTLPHHRTHPLPIRFHPSTPISHPSVSTHPHLFPTHPHLFQVSHTNNNNASHANAWLALFLF